MVFRCIASVRTETIDSDARRSLEDALRSVAGDGLPCRCPEPTDDAPSQQPPRPSNSLKKLRIKREGKENAKGGTQKESSISMEAPPQMAFSRSCSLPCNMEAVSGRLKRSQSSQSYGNPYRSSCDTIQTLKVAPMHHEAHLAFPLPHEGLCRGSEMDKAGQLCVRHLSGYSYGSTHLQDTVISHKKPEDCNLERADSFCRSSFACDTNSFSCRDGYGFETQKNVASDGGAGHCSVMMWLPHRCVNLVHLLRSGLTKLDNNMKSSFKSSVFGFPKGTSKDTSKGSSKDEAPKAKASANT